MRKSVSRLILSGGAVAVLLYTVSCTLQKDQAPATPTGPLFAKGGASNRVKSVTVSPSSASITGAATRALTAMVSPGNTGATVAWT